MKDVIKKNGCLFIVYREKKENVRLYRDKN